jgi:tetratricopeptide (TPR) repeat protein
MGNLGVSLLDLHSKTAEEGTLQEAFELLQETLQLVPENNSFRPRAKVNLANAYRALYERDGDASHLDQAIALHEQALEETPLGHSMWDVELRQGHLVRCLIARGRQEDIARAMTLLSRTRSSKGPRHSSGGGGATAGDESDENMNALASPPASPASSYSSLTTREFDVGVPSA